MNLLVYFGLLEFGLIGIGAVAGSALARARRSHFGVRIAAASLSLFAVLTLVLDGSLLAQDLGLRLWLVLVAGVAFLGPVLWYRSSDPAAPASGGDGDGASSPDQPWSPSRPGGGFPLPDAEPALARARDHNRLKLTDGPPSRRKHQPERAPSRAPARAR